MGAEEEPKPKNILVVDNEKEIVGFIEFLLGGEGYKIRACYNPQDALEEVKRLRPDLIISDVRMPKMWGPEMLRILDQDEETRGIPAILMSATDYLAVNRENTRFLPKPFDNDCLVKTVAAQLNGNNQLGLAAD